jgi:chorismate mutase
MSEIQQWRATIDAVETEILDALTRRAEAAAKIGAWKRQEGLPVLDPRREQEILERVARRNPGPLSAESVQRIFATIIEETRCYEESVHRNADDSTTGAGEGSGSRKP